MLIDPLCQRGSIRKEAHQKNARHAQDELDKYFSVIYFLAHYSHRKVVAGEYREQQMDTGMMILGFLMSGPKTGYKIRRITGKLMMAYNLSLNQIYPALRKLESTGLVKKEVVFQTGKPNKHVYTITPEGRDAFEKKLKGPPIPVDYELDFLTRMFFFRFLDKDEIVRQFEQEISSLDEQLEDLDQIKPESEREGDENGRFIFSTIVSMIEMLKDRYAAELERRKKKMTMHT